MSTWHAGRSLHRSLDKLLSTWVGIFPQPVLDEIAAQLAAARAAAAPAYVQPPAGYGFPAAAPQPQLGFGGAPAAAAVLPYQQPPLQQAPGPGLGGFPAGPPVQPGPYLQPVLQQQQLQPYAAAPPQAQQVNVSDLLSSLVNAGLLSAPVARPAAPAPAAGVGAPEPHHAAGNGRQQSASPAPVEQREQPATTKFIPERLKVQIEASAGLRAPPRALPHACAAYFPPALMPTPLSPHPSQLCILYIDRACVCGRGAPARRPAAAKQLTGSGLPPTRAMTQGSQHRDSAQIYHKNPLQLCCDDQQAGRHTGGPSWHTQAHGPPHAGDLPAEHQPAMECTGGASCALFWWPDCQEGYDRLARRGTNKAPSSHVLVHSFHLSAHCLRALVVMSAASAGPGLLALTRSMCHHPGPAPAFSSLSQLDSCITFKPYSPVPFMPVC